MAQGETMDRSLVFTQEHKPWSAQKNRPSSLYSTEIIHALFGTSVGACWGDFSCNYHRLQGRLYASSNAILFYSHLFGFERRLCLLWKDVLEVESYRTTSIRVRMNTICEEDAVVERDYIFKTLTDRDYVVNLLQALQSASNKNETFDGISRINIKESPTTNATYANEEKLALGKSEENGENQTSSPTFSARPRSKSLNYIEEILPAQDERIQDDSSVVTSSDSIQVVDLKVAWDELKINSSEWKKTALEAMTLPCDLDSFYDSYLADNAPYSIERYKRDVVGDSDINTSIWHIDGDTHTRTISFQHPIDSKFGSMVPSSTFTTKSQRLRRFGDFGLCMETSTEVTGIPYSDCFRVEDQWLVEPRTENPGEVVFTVHFQTRFIKSTLFKKVIQNSAQKEIENWFLGYSDMLLTSIEEADGELKSSKQEEVPTSKPDIEIATVVKKSPFPHGYRSILLVICFLLIAILVCTILVMLFHVKALHGDMELLRKEVAHLRAEQIESLVHLRDAIENKFCAS